MGSWSGMGCNGYSLDYPSLQAFINTMYKDEASQLEAMCRFIRVNGLDALKNKVEGFCARLQWPSLYNNNYDIKHCQCLQVTQLTQLIVTLMSLFV
ncbi:N-acetylmuramidase family protein [Acinetobacter sp. 1124_18A]